MVEYAIQAQNVVKKFGDFTAIDNITLNVPKGSIYGFLGPNGCGKSTTIRVLTGLLSPSEGNVDVLGLEIPKESEKLRLKIGYMTQKFSLYDDLTVEENLQFIGQIFGMDKKTLTQRINEQLATYGLDQRRKQRVSGMSGGQKQRLSLAAATMHKPELLFLDEPTSAVDPENRREFWEQLFDLCDQGTTILVTTHYMDEAERCHRLAIMEAGLIRADGAPEELMAQMGVNIVEVKADNLRSLKEQLLPLAEVRSAAQLGIRLRVLIDQRVADPIAWLRATFPRLQNAEMNLARPSLEDVFVSVTGEGRQ
ncbi:ABC transporter ATP-binding protein [Vibrio vulnificus]|uniref:ABC-type multidrug transport system, ATPase component n=1 Tax=Vibrio vulnificus (strain CMCP6) TaxID=216895 RepID=A0A3Q0KYF9_VIBVU|nr:ABC transporter ATP-binding protein [Vibrio vulnificus]AAO07544.1 ABC-type multidrug transport system, ATPase component [Vibrio vulnificus CMCP6]MCU8348451.1 ABC transporter ATP-binding protein [Vibrio vulnificus]QBN17110.1 ABC transporter ATP-binding protein [Vibrio vulnificus]HAS6254350.1 ATP-binding cassette domain-containing protein [Vibrio vulnificus]HAS6258786.1 ATP-binding cassette domain-containing protein [Vibrio vulnificus]